MSYMLLYIFQRPSNQSMDLKGGWGKTKDRGEVGQNEVTGRAKKSETKYGHI